MSGRKEKTYELPQATVARLVHKANPNVTIKKDAKEAIAKIAGIFVLYLSHNANIISQREHRQTIQAKDILETLKDIEFDCFCEDLKLQLHNWKIEQNAKKNNKLKRKMKKSSLVIENTIVDESKVVANVVKDTIINSTVSNVAMSTNKMKDNKIEKLAMEVDINNNMISNGHHQQSELDFDMNFVSIESMDGNEVNVELEVEEDQKMYDDDDEDIDLISG